ncbi:uncharacterized protein [Gossypium hirsutum]|uniref:Uncharacterized protein n=1 Tax=Gossypium hirsutum TaxID=3635 RepID=A0ABM2YXT6_GOSHI|nr:uncharacterized protein LOC121208025 [Gossypium hirsutum]
MGRGHRAPGRCTNQTEVRQSALAYAARCQEDRDALDVITCSTHFYVASSISENLGISIECNSSEINVLSPLGQFVQVNRRYRNVLLEVQGTVLLANLMELPFWEFDLIFGMDCERQYYFSNVISTLVAGKLVRKGCEAYLAYVSVSVSKNSSVRDIRTVREFSDVFTEELPALVSIASYCMASKELIKLEAQLQELLDRGFIRPSMSP